MADSSDQENQELITALHLFTISNICEIAGVVLLAYDHLLTISGEIEFVWRRKFSGATVVFLLNRYVTLFGKIMLPISTFWWPNQTDKIYCYSCAAPIILSEIFSVVAYFVVAVFSALRVYAIWNKDWRPLVLVLAIALTIPAMNMYHYILSIPQAFLFPLYGCAESTELTEDQLAKSLLVSIAIHSCAIAADLLVIILTWVKTYEIKKLAGVLRSDATFSTLLLRDGTLYFGIMLLLNAVDLIVLRSDVIFNPLPVFIDVFTCILISRFMLNLRQVARRGSGEALSAAESFSRFSTVRFSPDIVGDLGAPLGHGDWAGTTVQAGYASESTSDLGHGMVPSLPFVEQKAWEVVVKSPLATDLDIGGLVELQPSHPPSS